VNAPVYLAYATSGREFEAADRLTALGFTVWCGRRIDFIRKGKRRRPEAVEKPKLPNYLFLTLTPDEWHRLQYLKDEGQVKHIAGTMYQLRRDDKEALTEFRAGVDDAHAEGQRIAKNNDIAEMAQYRTGQALVDLTGTFADVCLTFRRMVERAHEMHPKIEAEMELMGRMTRVYLDPISVKAAE
jgi:DNA-binding PucR family transcriptional regulator